MTKRGSLSDFHDEEWSIVPNGLKKLIQFALNGEVTPKASDHDGALFPGFYWGGSAAEYLDANPYGFRRYYNEPIEFFAFANLGEDGIRYGYVVHAPELDINNLPIGIFDPIPNRGVRLLGNNFEDALDKLLSEALGFYSTDEELQMIHAIASLLDVQPSVDKRNLRYMEYHEPILPAIPPGWHYEPSGDGIGVLAPREAFIEDSPTCETWSFNLLPNQNYQQKVEAVLQLVEECLHKNAPGSALFVLRELYWRSADDRVFIQSKALWKDAYSQLQRPFLSDVVEKEAEFRQELLEERQIYSEDETGEWGATDILTINEEGWQETVEELLEEQRQQWQEVLQQWTEQAQEDWEIEDN